MAPRTDREEILAAWRALGGNADGEGWRTIAVALGGPCRLFAGRHFPGNEEALLVAFASACVPSADQLPQGRGFLVSRADIGGTGSCVALCRESAGSLDLFAMMAVDIADTLAGVVSGDDGTVLQVFLSRIKAWQEFMRRSSDSVLSAEAEVGLFGELEFLQAIVAAGVPVTIVIEAWQGPLDGIQDFVFRCGAIEVKSTVSPSGFPATISSFEQLDDSLSRPLFLAAVRLGLGDSGKTLPGTINELRDLLADEPSALLHFNTRLLHAGFFDQVADRYIRRFCSSRVTLLVVANSFPRLTRANVPIEIRRGVYEIDLDLVLAENVELDDALKQLGVA